MPVHMSSVCAASWAQSDFKADKGVRTFNIIDKGAHTHPLQHCRRGLERHYIALI